MLAGEGRVPSGTMLETATGCSLESKGSDIRGRIETIYMRMVQRGNKAQRALGIMRSLPLESEPSSGEDAIGGVLMVPGCLLSLFFSLSDIGPFTSISCALGLGELRKEPLATSRGDRDAEL